MQCDEIDWFWAPSGCALSYTQNGRIESLTFSELRICANQIAANLSRASVKSGSIIALESGSPSTMVKLIYGILAHGSVLLPVDESALPSRRNAMLQLAGCKGWVSSCLCDHLPSDIIELSSSELLVTIESQPNAMVSKVSAEALSLIVSTSGSTGEPKGVMLSGENLRASAMASNRRLHLIAGDRWLNVLPLRHIGGLSILYRCLQAGAEMVLLDQFDPETVWDQITHHGITHLSLVPTMLHRLLSASKGQNPPSTLRIALIGGGALSIELARKARLQGWPLCVTYGMSETASQTACDIASDAGQFPGYVGQPLDRFKVRINTRERIEVTGPALMLGYLNRDKRVGVGLKEGWFETGDLGRIDEQGGLHILGRADRMLISGGVNVHPASVEHQLSSCPGVTEITVLGLPNEEWGCELVAVYTGDAFPDHVKIWGRANLSGAECPKKFIRVNSLPYDAMGKLDQKRLASLVE